MYSYIQRLIILKRNMASAMTRFARYQFCCKRSLLIITRTAYYNLMQLFAADNPLVNDRFLADTGQVRRTDENVGCIVTSSYSVWETEVFANSRLQRDDVYARLARSVKIHVPGRRYLNGAKFWRNRWQVKQRASTKPPLGEVGDGPGLTFSLIEIEVGGRRDRQAGG